ncbi:MAG: asparagine synthase (glutamine-hydrolyzing) [Pseudomonadota bacterium]|nr:asparagine synthase (glutamine-hydrolyzing) [Pseudomonadota bacterium]
MCGIAGILCFRQGDRINPSDLSRMASAVIHRGPDAGGQWQSKKYPFGIASRRLRIFDIDLRADQPMSNEDGTVQLCFNGEIFNQAELRRALVYAGHRFRTDHSDTEVLVHGYEEWGCEGLLQRLDGMFAFALWDDNSGKLFLARDRLGVKPLYLAKDQDRVLFASEIKAILPIRKQAPDIEPLAMYHYLTFHTAPAPLTMFKGIWKLPAGCLIRFDADGSHKAERYWRPRPGRGIDPAELVHLDNEEREAYFANGVRSRLEAAVDKQLMADAPVGVLLSGGIDSSTNVALMAERLDRPVDTFTVGFKDHTALNEFAQAESVAKYFGSHHHSIAIDGVDMEQCLDEMFYYQDEPLADCVCVPLYYVSKLINENGTRVVQVGEGADELFAGYDGYLSYLKFYDKYWRRWGGQSIAGPLAVAGKFLRGFVPTNYAHIDVLERAMAGQEPFWSGAIAFGEMRKRAILKYRDFRLPEAPFNIPGIEGQRSGALDSFGPVQDILGGLAGQYDEPLTKMAWLELHIRLPELLLMRVDKMTMAHSVEARVPFLDHSLVEFAMDIPQAVKVKGGTTKYILKKAVCDLLPESILNRPKFGFGAPIAEWLRGEFGARVETEICGSRLMTRGWFDIEAVRQLVREHREERRDASVEIWTMFNLTSWYDRWVDA